MAGGKEDIARTEESPTSELPSLNGMRSQLMEGGHKKWKEAATRGLIPTLKGRVATIDGMEFSGRPHDLDYKEIDSLLATEQKVKQELREGKPELIEEILQQNFNPDEADEEERDRNALLAQINLAIKDKNFEVFDQWFDSLRQAIKNNENWADAGEKVWRYCKGKNNPIQEANNIEEAFIEMQNSQKPSNYMYKLSEHKGYFELVLEIYSGWRRRVRQVESETDGYYEEFVNLGDKLNFGIAEELKGDFTQGVSPQTRHEAIATVYDLSIGFLTDTLENIDTLDASEISKKIQATISASREGLETDKTVPDIVCFTFMLESAKKIEDFIVENRENLAQDKLEAVENAINSIMQYQILLDIQPSMIPIVKNFLNRTG